MIYIKKYGIQLLYTFITAIIAIFILTSIYYFNLIGDNIYKFLKLFIIIVDVFINSFILGKSVKQKGYLEGIKFGLFVIILFLIPTIISSQLKIKLFLYYTVIITSATLGSMFGISKKETKS